MVAPPRRRACLAWAAWCAVAAVALWARPPVPLDETRYLSVAWEMWQRGDFLVPHMNGVPYHHKPPLLFWIFHAGWAVFGVVEWWPRLVAPLLFGASLALLGGLGRRLAPDTPAGRLAPLLLIGCWYPAFYATLAMFDFLVVVAVLLLVHGALDVRAGRRRGFVLVAAASLLGVLGKGPVLLLYSLPVVLFLPWWGGAGLRRRTLALAGANLGGALLALAWAIPAARAGGPDYAEAILWGQSAGRMASSFAHGRPAWWYLLLLPALVAPWTLVPACWRGRSTDPPVLPGGGGRSVARLLAVWILLPLLLLSLVSGKQPHYLLPLFPPLALAGALQLSAAGVRPRRLLAGAGGLLAALGAGMLAVGVAGHERLPPWTADLPWWPGAALVALGAVLAARRWTPAGAALAGALAAPALLLVLHLGLLPAARPAYDLRPAAERVAALQAAGRPIAWLGDYQDQLHFLGRLRDRIAPLAGWEGLQAWWGEHPDGLALVTLHEDDPRLPAAVFAQPYLDRWLALLSAPGH